MHVDAVTRLFAPDVDPAPIATEAVRRHSGWFRPGELAQLVLDVLGTAPAMLLIREIAVQVMDA